MHSSTFSHCIACLNFYNTIERYIAFIPKDADNSLASFQHLLRQMIFIKC